MQSERRAEKPGKYQQWDEIRIVTVPRYKTSMVSGCEWRTSQALLYYNKGEEIFRYDHYFYGIAESFQQIFEKHSGYDKKAFMYGKDDICDQESCLLKSTNTYMLKKEVRHAKEVNPYDGSGDSRPLIRKFCDLHSKRGDCSLEDADDNYVILYGDGPMEPQKKFISKSSTMFV